MDPALEMSNLEEFSTLCFSSCTSEVFTGLPNLRRLNIRETPSESIRKYMGECLIDMSTLALLLRNPPEELKKNKRTWESILKFHINKTLIQKTRDSSPIFEIKRKFDEQATKLSGMWDELLDNIFGSSSTAQ
ncbi:hypothetical protein HAX54_037763 [Datura stramonium]|uniref:Uncharacterized protein n=1 Tax=Datura stramonium TaxID=4076 RepID=A0ABS8RP88_DATST|nr:hypothetical protein [Datura stramonium]